MVLPLLCSSVNRVRVGVGVVIHNFVVETEVFLAFPSTVLLK